MAYSVTNIVLKYKNQLEHNHHLQSRVGIYNQYSRLTMNNVSGIDITDQDLNSKAYDFEIENHYEFGPRVSLRSGIYFKMIPMVESHLIWATINLGVPASTNFFENNHDTPINTYSVYSQLAINITDRLKLIAGLRAESISPYKLNYRIDTNTSLSNRSAPDYFEVEYDNSQLEIIPQIACIYDLTKKSTFKFMYGEAVNHPSWFQNSEFLYNRQTPEIKPERIRTIELNFIHNPIENLNINLSIFRNELEELITREQGFDENNNYFTSALNTGNLITYGAEFEIDKSFYKKLFLSSKLAYQTTEDKNFPSYNTPYSPEILYNFSSIYKLSSFFTLSVKGNYVSKMKTSWIQYFDKSIDRIGTDSPSHWKFNASILYKKPFDKGLEVQLTVQNIFDTDIIYPTLPPNTPFFDKGTYGNGRSFYFSIGYKF